MTRQRSDLVERRLRGFPSTPRLAEFFISVQAFDSVPMLERVDDKPYRLGLVAARARLAAT